MTAIPIVERAAAVAAHDHAGIVGYRVVQHSRVDGGPIHRRDVVELAVVFDGGTLVNVRVFRHVENGNIAAEADNDKLAKKLEQGSASSGFAVPFDERHLGEYDYTAAGTVVHFVARIRDANHGDGRFTVDPSGHVVAVEYAPVRLPQYAQHGIVSVRRAEVLTGFWATVHQDQTYTGSYGFIRGSAAVTVDQSHFVRFGNRSAALSALAAGTI